MPGLLPMCGALFAAALCICICSAIQKLKVRLKIRRALLAMSWSCAFGLTCFAFMSANVAAIIEVARCCVTSGVRHGMDRRHSRRLCAHGHALHSLVRGQKRHLRALLRAHGSPLGAARAAHHLAHGVARGRPSKIQFIASAPVRPTVGRTAFAAQAEEK